MQPHATILNQDDAGSSVSRLMQHDPKGCTPTLDLQGEVAVRSLARPKDRAPYRCPPALPLYLKVKGRAMVLAHQTMGALSESSSALTAYGPYRDLDLGPPRGHAPSHVKGVLGGGLPSLSFGLPSSRPFGVAVRSLRSLSLRSRPGCPFGPSSSRSFGVAVRRCAPTRLSLWDILLPPLWGGRIPVLALRATSSSLAVLRPWPVLALRATSSSLAVLRPWPVLALRATSSSLAVLRPSRPWWCHQCRKSKSSIMEGLATHGRK